MSLLLLLRYCYVYGAEKLLPFCRRDQIVLQCHLGPLKMIFLSSGENVYLCPMILPRFVSMASSVPVHQFSWNVTRTLRYSRPALRSAFRNTTFGIENTSLPCVTLATLTAGSESVLRYLMKCAAFAKHKILIRRWCKDFLRCDKSLDVDKLSFTRRGVMDIMPVRHLLQHGDYAYH
jgi:hypothetical protein